MKTLLNNGSNKLAGLNSAIQEKKAANVKTINSFNASTVVLSHKQMTASDTPDVGSTTNKNTNQLALYFCPTTATKALIAHFKLTKETIGEAKYIGLVSKLAAKMQDRKQFCTDDKEVWVTMVNNDMVEELIQEMKACDLCDEENIKKIFWDLTVIYRMYQERIIDSAKKAYVVDILIAIENYRALSLQPVKHIVAYGDEDIDFDFEDKSNHVLTEGNSKIVIYKSTPEKELPDGTKRKFFRDPVSEIQASLAKFLEDLVNIATDIKVEMPQEEIERLLSYAGDGPVADLNTSVKYGYRIFSQNYRTAMSEINKEEDMNKYLIVKERYNKSTDTLAILTRQLLDGYTPVEAASIMQLIACTTADGFNADSTNQIAINLLTPEYMTMILEKQAQVKDMGYPVHINVSLKEGDVIELVNGIAEDGSVVNFGKEIEYATGIFTIIKFNGRLYATQKIKFDVPKADFTKRVFFVNPKSINDLDVVVDGLKEGSMLTVKKDGTITKQGAVIADVKYEGNGEGIEKLLGVQGTVTYLKVAEFDNGNKPVIMFELSDVEVFQSVLESEDDIVDEFEVEGEIAIDSDDVEIEIDKELDFDAFDETDIEIEL